MPPGDDAPAEPLNIARAVRLCQADETFVPALRQLYRAVDAETAASGLTCMGGGACCKFDLADHRLYLSTGELALLTAEPPPGPLGRPGRCPYQLGPRCLGRDRRPLGCRTFFCAPRGQDVRVRLYEAYHRQIRSLHERRWLPYAYVELTSTLSQLFLPKRVTRKKRPIFA